MLPHTQVLCVGPTGTGKTLTAADKLIRGMPDKYMSDFLTFSARTSANQTQDIIDAKLDKRYARMCALPHSQTYTCKHKVVIRIILENTH